MVYFFILNFLNKGLQVALPLLLPVLRQTHPISDAEVGIVTGLAMASSLATLALLPIYLHRLGVRRLLLIAHGAFAAALALLLISPTLITLSLSSICIGIGNGLIESLSDAQVARSAPSGHVATTIAQLGIWGDVGRIVSSIGIVSVVLALGLTSVVVALAGVVVVFGYVLTLVPIHEPDMHSDDAKSRLNPAYWITQAIKGIDSYASASLYIFLPYLYLSKGYALTDTGLMAAIFFAGYMSGRAVFGRLSDRHGATGALILAETVMCATIIGMIYSASYPLLVTLTFVLGACTRGTAPVIKSMTAHSLHPDQYERGYGYSQLIDKSINTVNRFVAGYVFAVYGIDAVFVMSAAAALTVALPAYLLSTQKRH